MNFKGVSIRTRLSLLELLLVLVVLAMALYVGYSYWANTDPKVKELARRSLIVAGYTDVVIGDYRMWGCSRSDSIHLSFTGKGPTGIPTKGVACADLFSKEFTVRH